ncbi:hypothetical protein PAXRUDRAFT_146177 [Paxillus rubicundulus Ve08.2h10]|uniref:Uncharacterized protein n=1 Tax=Paxillus rubicundulus Ve08.2h10 TaxID=930991 RepID=A0A0D0E5Y8_9AGAM|nr:hypothetical protein PAXRUDRAFT_146177 [Paxillus rubicundulus Ve08.2h10]
MVSRKKQAEDILTMMSEHCTVKFCHLDGKVDILKGHWCNECWTDEVFLSKNSKQKAFHIGSNSLCCQHVQSHYQLYKMQCARRKIREHHHAVPHDIVRAQQDAKKNTK